MRLHHQLKQLEELPTQERNAVLKMIDAFSRRPASGEPANRISTHQMNE
jgi:hypothetical protein